MAFAGELGSVPSEPDSPSLDYVQRYAPPTEDDPDDPTTTAAAAAAGLLGPDLHAPLELEPEPAEAGAGRGRGPGWRRARSVIEQLRQRALAGSSSDDEGQADGDREWQSLDIPALLLSPHHAAALHSLSSSEDDTSSVPDFADQAIAGEADRAAQAAAELVPPELRPLARAANLLDFHTQQGRRGRRPGPGPGLDHGGGSSSSSSSSSSQEAEGADAPEPDLHLMAANRFSGLCEPLTEEQLEAVAMIANAAATAAIAATAAAAIGSCCSGADPASAAAAAAASPPPPQASTSEPPPSAAAAATSRMTAAAAAAAAALAEEGVEWLDAVRPAAAPQRLEAVGEDVAVSMDLEERSVQLRRRPRGAAAESDLDEATRARAAETAAQELAEAEAHVVGHHGGAAAGSAAPTHGSVGRFVELKLAAARAVGAGGGEEGAAAAAAAAVEGVATAGGREAADAAAASVAAEARRAVWGEAGWPYGAATRSTDLVEELKHSIRQQQVEAERGAPGTLLP